MPDNTIYAVSYARVSTARGSTDRDQNPESQHCEIEKYARANGIKILRKYTDESTGTNDCRDGLDMIFGFKRHHPELTTVLCLDADRLSRSVQDAPQIIKDFNQIGVVVRYVADPSIKPETLDGSVIQAFKSHGAQAYTDAHGLKVKAGMRRAEKEGQLIHRPRTIVVDIDLVMDYSKRGMSLYRIAKILNVSYATVHRRVEESGMLDQYHKNIAEYHQKVSL